MKGFLTNNPQGNFRAVNEAWAADGMKGTISLALIDKTRAQMGLSGNLRAKSVPKTAPKLKAAAKKPNAATVTPGKTSFVKQFLDDHPEGSVKAVNQAWTAAGFEGDD